MSATSEEAGAVRASRDSREKADWLYRAPSATRLRRIWILKTRHGSPRPVGNRAESVRCIGGPANWCQSAEPIASDYFAARGKDPERSGIFFAFERMGSCAVRLVSRRLGMRITQRAVGLEFPFRASHGH